MPRYSLDLDGPDSRTYVLSHDFPTEMRRGDRFDYGGFTWRIVAVSQRHYDAAGEAKLTLHCRAV